jgi:DNA-binding NtrC family response regulator
MNHRAASVPEPTALLLSQDAALIEEIRGIKGTVRRLRLEVCETVAQAHAALERQSVALLLVHVTGSSDETDVARLVGWAAAKPPCATIILSDDHNDHQAAGFLRAGAADCLRRPLDHGKLACLMDILALGARPKANGTPVPGALSALPRHAPDLSQAVMLEPDMMELMEQLRRVVPQETTLLLTGETGTGKTRFARLIHELSPRRDDPFLVVDCGALSAPLIESELFGHIRGAFTGADRDRPGKLAAAGKGTLLLDEITSLTPNLQVKLLRAVDERVFEPVGADQSLPLLARLVVTSTVPLDREVAAGRFRTDLFYRLNVVSLYLPPLRERVAAVAPLARKFLGEFVARNRPDLRGLSAEALRALEAYSWPGNVRQLRNVIEHIAALSPGPDVMLADLPEAIRSATSRPPAAQGVTKLALFDAKPAETLAKSNAEAEKMRILEALRKHGNNRVRAAAELGISRVSLYKKLQKHGLLCPA